MAKRQDMKRLIQTVFRASGKSVKAVSIEASVPYASAHGLLLRDQGAALKTLERICPVLGLVLVRKGD